MSPASLVRALHPLAALLTLAALQCLAQEPPEPTPLTGRVVDGEGRPVAGIRVASYWSFDDRIPEAQEETHTDEAGAFALPVQWFGKPRPVLALDVEGGRGALAICEPHADAPVLELRPLTRVSGRIDSTELGFTPEWTNAYVHARIAGDDEGWVRVARSMTADASFWFLLPAGDYQVQVYGTDLQHHYQPLAITGATGGELDLGTIDVPSTPLARLYGQPAPELTVTAARGIDPEAPLSKLRGQYVVLEFWGHW